MLSTKGIYGNVSKPGCSIRCRNRGSCWKIQAGVGHRQLRHPLYGLKLGAACVMKSVWWKYLCLSWAKRSKIKGVMFQEYPQLLLHEWICFQQSQKKNTLGDVIAFSPLKDHFCTSKPMFSFTRSIHKFFHVHKWACVEQAWKKSMLL